jgi:hypothetical protein
MPNRNPLPLWIVVSIFLAAVIAVPWTCRLRSRTAPSPTHPEVSTLTELAELLSQAAPELRVMTIAKNGTFESGMYLCKDSRSWEQLRLLPRSSSNVGKWQGVVYCERIRSTLPEWEIQEWGEHAMQIGPFLFFGDTALLRRIDKLIRDHSKGEQDLPP